MGHAPVAPTVRPEKAALGERGSSATRSQVAAMAALQRVGTARPASGLRGGGGAAAWIAASPITDGLGGCLHTRLPLHEIGDIDATSAPVR